MTPDLTPEQVQALLDGAAVNPDEVQTAVKRTLDSAYYGPLEAGVHALLAAAPTLARQLLAALARAEAAERVMDDACKLWRKIGHPMLLAAALELEDARRAALAPTLADVGVEGRG